MTRSVTDLLTAVASPDPTPGGGSAAALAGALGASLLSMVAGLPKTKSGTPDDRTALDEARHQLGETVRALSALVERDAAAYDEVVAAFRQPKGTDEEKRARTAAIQAAMRQATEVPVETMRACVAALELGRPVVRHGNPSAASDIAVAVQVLMAGLQGALFNVEINIGSLKDEAVVRTISEEVNVLVSRASASARHIYESGGVVELLDQVAVRTGFSGPMAAPGGPA